MLDDVAKIAEEILVPLAFAEKARCRSAVELPAMPPPATPSLPVVGLKTAPKRSDRDSYHRPPTSIETVSGVCAADMHL